MRSLIAWWWRRPTALRWLAVVGEMGAIWLLSARPLPPFIEGSVGSLLHNSAHIVAYGTMGALLLLALAEVDRGDPALRSLLGSVAIAAGYGVVDELHQRIVPGRVSSIADVLSDSAGAWLGCAAMLGTWTGRARWWWTAAAATACSAATVLLATFTDW